MELGKSLSLPKRVKKFRCGSPLHFSGEFALVQVQEKEFPFHLVGICSPLNHSVKLITIRTKNLDHVESNSS